MSKNSLKIILGSKTYKKDNHIFINPINFQTPRVNAEDAAFTLKEIGKIENTSILGKTPPELLSYDQISLWWFSYPQIFEQYHRSLTFLKKFLDYISVMNPSSIYIENNFNNFFVLKQICTKKQIKLEYNKLMFFKFILKRYIKKIFKKTITDFLTIRKINRRIKIFHKKNISLPDFEDKIIVPLPQVYHREEFDFSSDTTKKGEFLIDPILDISNRRGQAIIIDLFSELRTDDTVLEERLESNLTCLPVEILFSNKLRKNHKKFLKNYRDLIISNDFRSLFEWNGISFWGEMQETFEKMTFEPYFPYWLKLMDSIKETFENKKPLVIFLPYETGPLALSFIAAAKTKKVKTIGIQHGLIYDYHTNYSHKSFISKENPYGFLIPDKLLVFGEIPKEILQKKDYPSENIIVFGNPMFFNIEQLKNNFSKKDFYQKFGIPKDKKIILFTPPGFQSYYEKGIESNYNTQILKKLIKEFSNNEEFIIILKPHPHDDVRIYKKILKNQNSSNIKIIHGDLLELIFISSVVVSTFSTTIIDALCFTKPVVQVKFSDVKFSMPYDNYNAVNYSELEELDKTILDIFSNQELVKELQTNSKQFIKKYYNIPGENPEKILKELIT